ncbi:MAG: hypothetical protein ACHQVS_02115 [Candidatus Babeliales bacterium]
MASSSKKHLENLRILYDKAQETRLLKIFVLSLLDFVHETEVNPNLQSIINQLLKEEEIRNSNFHELRNSATEELNTLYSTYKSYMGSSAPYDSFYAYGNDDPQRCIDTTRDFLIERHSILTDLLSQLVKQDPAHIPFIAQFADVQCLLTNRDAAYKIHLSLKTPRYNKWLKEAEDREYGNAAEPFYHWNIIAWIYQVHKNGESVAQELYNKGKVLESTRVIGFRRILKNILLSPNEQGSGITSSQVENFKYSLQKVWLYIQEKSENEETSTEKLSLDIVTIPSAEEPNLFKGYDTSTKTLLIGAHKIQFKKKGYQGPILTILTKDDECLHDEWPWDEVYEKTQYNVPSGSKTRIKKHRRRLYHAYEHLNEQVFKQSNGKISYFLIFNMDSVRINPIYLAHKF